MVAGGSPDWLPSGWTVQSNVLRSGRETRCFKNLQTGKRCFSRDDVMQCINMQNTQRRSQKNNTQLFVKQSEYPDWLPDGWVMETRTRQSGLSTGSKYRIYIDPLFGCKFYSKPEVVNYLKTLKQKRYIPEPPKTDIKLPASKSKINHSTTSEKNSVGEGSIRWVGNGKQSEYPDWLPDGWVMETRTRRSGSHIGSKYKVYIDPLIGCKFYSKPGVLNYLKSLKQKRYIPEQPKTDVKLPRGKVVVEDCTEENLPPGWKKEVKIRKNGNKIKRDLFYTDPVNGYVFQSKREVLRYLENGQISKYALKWKKWQVRDKELMNDQSSSKTDRPSTSEKNSAGNGSFDSANSVTPKACEPKRRQGKRLRSSVEESGENDETVKESKKQKEFSLPRRSSSRLAGIEPKLAINPTLRGSSVNAARRDPHKGELVIAVMAASLDGVSNIDTLVSAVLRDTSKPMKLVPRRCSRFNNASSANDADLDPGFKDSANQQIKAVPSNQSKKAHEDPNVTSKPVQKLENENIDIEKTVTCTFPSGELWSDPCIEFAFKTLTGAIPIDTAIQGCFQQQCGSSLRQRPSGPALPDIGSPGSFQNDISYLFDGPEKPSTPKQMLPPNSLVQARENASLPAQSVIGTEVKKDIRRKVRS